VSAPFTAKNPMDNSSYVLSCNVFRSRAG